MHRLPTIGLLVFEFTRETTLCYESSDKSYLVLVVLSLACVCIWLIAVKNREVRVFAMTLHNVLINWAARCVKNRELDQKAMWYKTFTVEVAVFLKFTRENKTFQSIACVSILLLTYEICCSLVLGKTLSVVLKLAVFLLQYLVFTGILQLHPFI